MSPRDPQPAVERPDWGALSRRRFLVGALGLGGAALGGIGLSACARREAQAADGQPLLVLRPGEVATLTALGEAILPPQAGFPDMAEAEVLRRLDEELYFVGASIRGDMHAALAVMAWSPLIYGHMRRFERLDAAARRDILERMMNSGNEILRAVGTNLKLVLHFMYFGHPATWRAIAYDGPFAGLPPAASAQRRHYAERSGRELP